MKKILYAAILLSLAKPASSFAQLKPPSVVSGSIDMAGASDEQLIGYTNHHDARVRVDAFSALVEKSHPACFSISLTHLNDIAEIDVKDGCFAETVMVGDAMIDKYAPYLKTTNGIEEKQVRDSMLLYTGAATLRSRSQLLQTMQPQESYYKRIRSLAVDEGDKNALVALAKYRKVEDKAFFISKLRADGTDLGHALFALSHFTDADFMPHLERIYKRSRKTKRASYLSELFRTIAAYGNDQSLAFLEKVYEQHKRRTQSPYLAAILTATEERRDPLYAGLETQVKKTISKRL
ncbi:MAG: hypothetical protein EOP56_02305 [Sphingobacteriales bacterium]|nr:MAG: hypothetical protein EOP56_02305 [Sphingobacteriales bacterium]